MCQNRSAVSSHAARAAGCSGVVALWSKNPFIQPSVGRNTQGVNPGRMSYHFLCFRLSFCQIQLHLYGMAWYDYSDSAAQKKKLADDIEKRRQRGESLDVFNSPTGNKLTQQFWGAAWTRHLETYGGYNARLGRGRSYLRQGKVLNLVVDEGIAAAEVAGSYLYEVEIRVSPLPADRWRAIKAECAGQVASLLDLLGGKLGDGVMKIITDPDKGLFPRGKEIRHQCSCPDDADLCKHQAAVLYAIAVLFDNDPKVFFELRGVDPSELIASSATALREAGAGTGVELAGEDLSTLFGIELADDNAVPLPAAESKPAPKVRKTAKKTKSG